MVDWLLSVDPVWWVIFGFFLAVIAIIVAVIFGVPQLKAIQEANLARMTVPVPSWNQTPIQTSVRDATQDNPASVRFGLSLLNEGRATARQIKADLYFGSYHADADVPSQIDTLYSEVERQLSFSAPLSDQLRNPPAELIRLVVRYEDQSNDSPYEIEHCFRLGSDVRSDATTWQAHQIDCTTGRDIDRPPRAWSARKRR